MSVGKSSEARSEEVDDGQQLDRQEAGQRRRAEETSFRSEDLLELLERLPCDPDNSALGATHVVVECS